jgi:teichoic acid transport system permease protein
VTDKGRPSGRGGVSAPGEAGVGERNGSPGKGKRGGLSGPGTLAAEKPGKPGKQRRGALSSPGDLPAPDGANATATISAALAGGDLGGRSLAEYATSYGLKPASARPGVFSYLRQLWQRRHFIVGFATARNVAMYTEAKLGQLWQVLTPLLNAAVYYLIFGILLNTKRGVPDYISFLVTGIFVFNFTQRSLIIASRVIHDSLPLIRALHFPRACLPLGYVIIELQQLLISFGVLFVIILVAGEPLTWYWLLIIPVLLLQTFFNVGVGMLLARWGAGFDDVSQLLPFIVRTWMYTSGVLFSIQALGLTAKNVLANHPHITYLLQINPAAVYITLIRNALLAKERASMPGALPYNAAKCAQYRFAPSLNVTNSAYCHAIVSTTDLWLYAVGWAVVAAVIGFLVFWQAETRYGRG